MRSCPRACPAPPMPRPARTASPNPDFTWPPPDSHRSGTLSYIFNTMKPGDRFSEVVWSAKRRGYTEPDAREDLSGGWPGLSWSGATPDLGWMDGSTCGDEGMPGSLPVPATVRHRLSDMVRNRLLPVLLPWWAWRRVDQQVHRSSSIPCALPPSPPAQRRSTHRSTLLAFHLIRHRRDSENHHPGA